MLKCQNHYSYLLSGKKFLQNEIPTRPKNVHNRWNLLQCYFSFFNVNLIVNIDKTVIFVIHKWVHKYSNKWVHNHGENFKLILSWKFKVTMFVDFNLGIGRSVAWIRINISGVCWNIQRKFYITLNVKILAQLAQKYRYNNLDSLICPNMIIKVLLIRWKTCTLFYNIFMVCINILNRGQRTFPF